MTREFPDELLSAFLDDELPPAERAMVEKHLAASEADRQLLTELKSLRSEVAALPPVAVNADFTERVVRAALAEAQRHNAATTAVALSQPPTGRTSRRWAIGAAVASAAALAACFLLVVQPWRTAGPQPGLTIGGGSSIVAPAVAIHDQLIKSLREAAPTDGEAVVLRLRVSKDVPLAEALDAALVKAGIAGLGTNDPIGVASLESAYRSALEAKYGRAEAGSENKALLDATVAAAQAVFVEAPLAQLEGALAELAAGLKQPLELKPECLLAYSARPDRQGEGEPGSATQIVKAPPPGQSFAQRLNAEIFRLEKKLTAAANAAVNQPQPVATIDPQQLVRVLILVEAE